MATASPSLFVFLLLSFCSAELPLLLLLLLSLFPGLSRDLLPRTRDKRSARCPTRRQCAVLFATNRSHLRKDTQDGERDIRLVCFRSEHSAATLGRDFSRRGLGRVFVSPPSRDLTLLCRLREIEVSPREVVHVSCVCDARTRYFVRAVVTSALLSSMCAVTPFPRRFISPSRLACSHITSHRTLHRKHAQQSLHRTLCSHSILCPLMFLTDSNYPASAFLKFSPLNTATKRTCAVKAFKPVSHCALQIRGSIPDNVRTTFGCVQGDAICATNL